MALNIVTDIDGNLATLRIEGRLAYDSAPELDDTITQLPETVKDIVCDVTRVNYVSSAGLRAFVRGMRTANSRGGSFKIVHPSDEVFDVFKMTGLAEVVNITR